MSSAVASSPSSSSGILSGFTGMGGRIKDRMSNMRSTTKAMPGKALKAVKEKTGGLFSSIGRVVSNTSNLLFGSLAGTENVLVNVVGGSIANTVMTATSGTLVSALKPVTGLVGGAYHGVIDGAKGGADLIDKTGIGRIPYAGAIISTIGKALFGLVGGAGGLFVGGTVGGVSGAGKGLKHAFIDTPKSFINREKALIDISGKSAGDVVEQYDSGKIKPLHFTKGALQSNGAAVRSLFQEHGVKDLFTGTGKPESSPQKKDKKAEAHPAEVADPH